MRSFLHVLSDCPTRAQSWPSTANKNARNLLCNGFHNTQIEIFSQDPRANATLNAITGQFEHTDLRDFACLATVILVPLRQHGRSAVPLQDGIRNKVETDGFHFRFLKGKMCSVPDCCVPLEFWTLRRARGIPW